MNKFLIPILFLSVNCFAVTEYRYKIPQDYGTLAAAFAAQAGNLVTASKMIYFDVYPTLDTGGACLYSTGAGYVISSACYVSVKAMKPHEGKFDKTGNYYCLTGSGTTGGLIFVNFTADAIFFDVDGLIIDQQQQQGYPNVVRGIRHTFVTGTASNVSYKNLIMKESGAYTPTSGDDAAIGTNGTGGSTITVTNCYFTGFGQVISDGGTIPLKRTWYFNNNTSYNCAKSSITGSNSAVTFDATNYTLYAKNNIFVNDNPKSTNWHTSGGTIVSSFNITDDATSPDVPYRNLYPKWVDKTNYAGWIVENDSSTWLKADLLINAFQNDTVVVTTITTDCQGATRTSKRNTAGNTLNRNIKNARRLGGSL